jgi:hypothetical protein
MPRPVLPPLIDEVDAPDPVPVDKLKVEPELEPLTLDVDETTFVGSDIVGSDIAVDVDVIVDIEPKGMTVNHQQQDRKLVYVI